MGGVTIYFLYDGSNPVCELDGSGNVLATNTWGGGLLSRHVGTASTFYTFDPSGNVTQRLDSSGSVLGTYAFDAFGLRTGTDATTDPYSSFGGQYGYYADAENSKQKPSLAMWKARLVYHYHSIRSITSKLHSLCLTLHDILHSVKTLKMAA